MNSYVRIISANCQGLRDASKRTDVINYLEDLQANILCLQETHWLKNEEILLSKIWNGDTILSGEKTNARGVAILIKRNFDYKINSIFKDFSGNLVSILITIDSLKYRIINIYVPNSDKPEFFEDLKQHIESSEHDHCIVCGDFNLTLNQKLDTYNYKAINNPKARTKCINFMETLNFTDAYRHLNGDIKRYTWRKRTPLKQARLDYFIVSDNLVDFLDKCLIHPGYRSDHSIVELTFNIAKFTKGKGIWKFNCSLLKNKDYLIKINNIIDQVKLSYTPPVYNSESLCQIPDSNLQFTITDSLFLETLLLKIRGETIKFASVLKRKNSESEKSLKSEIEQLETKKCVGENLAQELQLKKEELEKLRKTKIAGHIIRARAQWLNEGERPTKFFCSLEKTQYTEKTIKKIEKGNGKIISDQKQILNEVKQYYQNLFSNKDSEPNLTEKLEDMLSKHNNKRLTKEESNSLEGELT